MKKNELSLEKTNDYSSTDSPVLTVVMIHGIASNSSTYDDALKYFEKEKNLEKVRFVTFDLLGSGKSLKDDSLEYNYDEQIEALHNAIIKLGTDTPIVLIGHSLGTFIVTRYTKTYPDGIQKLILVSPPIYSPKDFDNPAFWAGIDMFKKVLGAKNPEVLKEKAFNNSMDNIVLCRDNYQTLAEIKVPTTLIFGTEDRIIASHNIPSIIKKNKNLKAIPTIGHHGVTKEKYTKITTILEETISEII
ncbi:alpha/beta hydrolase [Candidatus Saccharibacteria bacterium]|nr:alpha/beta hydrolase [Candidatus Saccharibacteria bacterium]